MTQRGLGFAWWKSGRSCGRGCPTDLAVPMAALASAIVILARFRAESARVDAHNQRLVTS